MQTSSYLAALSCGACSPKPSLCLEAVDGPLACTLQSAVVSALRILSLATSTLSVLPEP